MMTRQRAICALVCGAALLGSALTPPAAAAADPGPVVNLAVDAAAVASTAQTGFGPTLATDGNAATTWCAADTTAALTVDLSRPERVLGFGLNLSGPGGDIAIAVATRPGVFRPVQPLTGVPAGTPTWFAPSEPALRAARYVRLSVTGTAPVCVGELRVLGHARHAAAMQLGHDVSFAIQEAAIGNTYTDRGMTALPEQILADHGANYVRLRLWTDPPGGYSDLASVLEMARRARAAGMRLLLDFHYSDFWADPQTQNTPAAWAGQDLPTLARTVRTYTRDVLTRLHEQGTPADMVQIGNEIRNGILWPTGRIDWTTDAGWDDLGVLLRAGVAGAADAAGPTPRIVIHFDQGGDNAFSRTFFDNVVAQRVPFDIIGLSYYPFFHGTLDRLRDNMTDLAARYDRDIAIVETQYGWTLANGDDLGNFLWQAEQLLPGYPATPGGQLAFASDLVSALAAVPGGRGLGIFYWQPEWIPGVGWTPGAGTPNDNLTLFDFTGRALPAVEFDNPLLACDQYAPGQRPCTFIDSAATHRSDSWTVPDDSG